MKLSQLVLSAISSGDMLSSSHVAASSLANERADGKRFTTNGCDAIESGGQKNLRNPSFSYRTNSGGLHFLDKLDEFVTDGSDAHAAEERVIQELHQLGQELLGRWAHEAQAQVRTQHPHASQHGKKSLEMADHLRVDCGRGNAMAARPAWRRAAPLLHAR
jgi:hypothetical protein